MRDNSFYASSLCPGADPDSLSWKSRSLQGFYICLPDKPPWWYNFNFPPPNSSPIRNQFYSVTKSRLMVWTSLPPTHRVRREDEPEGREEDKDREKKARRKQSRSISTLISAAVHVVFFARGGMWSAGMKCTTYSGAQSLLPSQPIAASDTVHQRWNPKS